MKKLLKNEHFLSCLHTFITELLWDTTIGASVTHIILNQDLSKTALYSLGYAIFRTIIRVMREKYFKKKKEKKVFTPEELKEMNP